MDEYIWIPALTEILQPIVEQLIDYLSNLPPSELDIPQEPQETKENPDPIDTNPPSLYN